MTKSEAKEASIVLNPKQFVATDRISELHTMWTIYKTEQKTIKLIIAVNTHTHTKKKQADHTK